MTIAAFLLMPALVSWLVERSLVRLRVPRLMTKNHAGRQVPAVLGIGVTAAAVGVLLGALVAVAAAGRWERAAQVLAIVTAASVIVAGVGLVDDLSAGTAKGWRGHLGSAGRGRATTGLVKIAGIGAAAALVAGVLTEPASAEGWLAFAAATVAIAGSANVANGLDVVPGRTGKWFLLIALPVALWAPHSAGWAVLIVVFGAEAPSLWFDLRERGMLGDTGANLLGFVLAAAVVPGLGTWELVALAALIIGLNVAAETLTFSRIIDAVGPLRWFDRVGRRPPGPTFSVN